MKHQQGSAPNFTQACVVMFGVNITWIFVAIWAWWGIIAVAATGWAINRILSLIEARRS